MSDRESGDDQPQGQNKYHGQGGGMDAPGSSDFDSGQQQQGEQELATKMLQIQSKRFYLDVKQNRRGRFIKVAEIGADGRRSQIFLALSTAAEFRDHLSTFSDFYASLGPPNPENVPEDGKLKSEMMIKDNRRYYLDLKENSRGRFLRVSKVSQTITRGGPRSQIAIPAQGMIEFRDALTDLLEEFGTDDGGFKGELPEGRHMRVENKNFYFDIGQNNRGIYMRMGLKKRRVGSLEKLWWNGPLFNTMLRLMLMGSAVAVLCTLLLTQTVESCNEAVCASIVSKCMITQSCKCDLKNCSCCKECSNCLSYLYTECCSCVDMCPKPNSSANRLSTDSQVADLPEAIPNLFQVLTAERDPHERWLTFTFPVDFDISMFKPQLEKEFKYRTQSVEQEVAPIKDVLTLNCSVAYMSQCMSLNKCTAACQSMGAASFRWFHDGCCECVGDKCIKYGINESRCLRCPQTKVIPEEEADYGEEEDGLQA